MRQTISVELTEEEHAKGVANGTKQWQNWLKLQEQGATYNRGPSGGLEGAILGHLGQIAAAKALGTMSVDPDEVYYDWKNRAKHADLLNGAEVRTINASWKGLPVSPAETKKRGTRFILVLQLSPLKYKLLGWKTGADVIDFGKTRPLQNGKFIKVVFAEQLEPMETYAQEEDAQHFTHSKPR